MPGTPHCPWRVISAPRGHWTGVDRGSRITTAVSDDRSEAYASKFLAISRHLAHRRDRSSPSAALALTMHGLSARTTLAPGCAWRLSHHPGSPSAQPFIASVTRFGPSSMYPRNTLRSLPVRRPVAVSRRVPHRFLLGRQRPTRPPVTRYRPRCVSQASLRQPQPGRGIRETAIAVCAQVCQPCPPELISARMLMAVQAGALNPPPLSH